MNYWLAPNGKVYENDDIGRHYEMALDICTEKYPETINPYGIPLINDLVTFLENKGYIRYMDWAKPKWIVYGQKPTRIQITKMFDLTGYVYIK